MPFWQSLQERQNKFQFENWIGAKCCQSEPIKNQICRKCDAGFIGAVSSFTISRLLILEKYKNKYMQIIYSTASTK